MSNIREQIREGVNQRIRPLKFVGLRESDIIPLHEFIEKHGDEYAWESLKESKEEDEAEKSHLSGDQLKDYNLGDILMPKELYSPGSKMFVPPHRVLIIDISERDEFGVCKYHGFLMSSTIDKSNKAQPKHYPNNIYYKDYSTILYRGPRSQRSGFVRVDDIVEFDSTDLSDHGVWKGTVSKKFFRFINNCYNNYTSGISNERKRWYGEYTYQKKNVVSA